MARFLADENVPLAVVTSLRKLGHDVKTLREADLAGIGTTDERVLQTARENSRAVITLNRRDFILLHRQMPDHAGIIVCTVDPDSSHQAARIHDCVLRHSQLIGLLLRVNQSS